MRESQKAGNYDGPLSPQNNLIDHEVQIQSLNCHHDEYSGLSTLLMIPY